MYSKLMRLISLDEKMIVAEMIWKDLDKRLKTEKDAVKQLKLRLQQNDQRILMYQYSVESMLIKFCDL